MFKVKLALLLIVITLENIRPPQMVIPQYGIQTKARANFKTLFIEKPEGEACLRFGKLHVKGDVHVWKSEYRQGQ